MAEDQVGKKIILIVNGYGCHLNTPLGHIYLPKVVRFIDENFEQIMKVIFTGGFTQHETAPGISEARLMADYIRTHSKCAPDIIVECDSYTTHENIYNSEACIWEVHLYEFLQNGKPWPDVRIVVFCEALRTASVIMLSRRFLLQYVDSIDDIMVETASWERLDPMRFWWKMFLDWLDLKYRWLGIANRKSNIQRLKSKNR